MECNSSIKPWKVVPKSPKARNKAFPFFLTKKQVSRKRVIVFFTPIETNWTVYLANDNQGFLDDFTCRKNYKLEGSRGRVYVAMIERMHAWIRQRPKWTFTACKVKGHIGVEAQEYADTLACLGAQAGCEMFNFKWVPLKLKELDPYVVNERVWVLCAPPTLFLIEGVIFMA